MMMGGEEMGVSDAGRFLVLASRQASMATPDLPK